MKPYIVNLTDSLIRKHRFDEAKKKDETGLAFFGHIKMVLRAFEVQAMNPETLGRIVCNLETGDVLASKQELFENIGFTGDMEDFQRNLVATCLTYIIFDRLDPDSNIQLKYPSKKKTTT